MVQFVRCPLVLFFLFFTTPIQGQGRFELDNPYSGSGTLGSIHWRLREIERISGLRDRYQDLAQTQAEALEVNGDTIRGKLISVEAYVQFDGDMCLNLASREFDFRAERTTRIILDGGWSKILATSLEGEPLDSLPLNFPVNLTYDTHFGMLGTVEDTGGRYGPFMWRIEGMVGARGVVQEVVTGAQTLRYTFATPGLFRVEAQGLVMSPVFRGGHGSVGISEEFLVGLCGRYPALDITYIFG